MDYELLERIQEQEVTEIESPHSLDRRNIFAANREIKMIYDIEIFTPDDSELNSIALVRSKVLNTPPLTIIINNNQQTAANPK